MPSNIQHFDTCIVGAGMVGGAVACALAKLGLSVALIEPTIPEPFEPSQLPDLRVSALNKHSIDLLKGVDALQNIKDMRFRPYDALMVWEDELAKTHFKAQDIGESQLGIFVENRVIQLALLKSIEQQHGDTITIYNTQAQSINSEKGELVLSTGEHIQAKLIIGADGANSQVRKAAGIGQTGWNYAQRANLILIKSHKEIDDLTWQQFTPSGPLALLPMHENYACLVWYASKEKSHAIAQMSADDLKQAVCATFPSQLDDFELINKAGFGLTRMHANHYWRDKAVLIGDAAHTINPLAGQGVNLGFKDVSALVDAVKQSGLDNLKAGLHEYEHKRRGQNLLMMSTMDALYAGFSNELGPIKFLRNAALAVAERAGPLKSLALKYAMGIS